MGREVLFVLYLSRSGSTLICDRLMGRFQVTILPETNLVGVTMKSLDKNGRIVSPYRTYNLILKKDYKFKDLGIEKDELKQLLDQHKGWQIKEFLNNLGNLYQKKQGLTDHIIAFKGSNIFQVRQLIKYIPDSKFLNIVRDVRGTFNSRKMAFNNSNKPFKNNVFLEAKKWNDGNANFYWLKRNHSGNTCEVFYENFVAKPEIELTLKSAS